MAYWDTSCIVKLYAPEPDSADLQNHALADSMIVTAELTRLELWTTLRRRESAGELRAGEARRALDAYDADVAAGLIAVEPMDAAAAAAFESLVDRCLGRAPPLPLRTLDAIHLATATAAGEREVVATDRRLRDAAILLGFRVHPPP